VGVSVIVGVSVTVGVGVNVGVIVGSRVEVIVASGSGDGWISPAPPCAAWVRVAATPATAVSIAAVPSTGGEGCGVLVLGKKQAACTIAIRVKIQMARNLLADIRHLLLRRGTVRFIIIIQCLLT
jgi:hypothetical protein